MIVGGVIGAQIGARLGTILKAEYLRGILAILVLAVCAKIFTDLTLTPANLFSLDLLWLIYLELLKLSCNTNSPFGSKEYDDTDKMFESLKKIGKQITRLLSDKKNN